MNKAVVNGMQITSSLDAEELAFIGDMSLDTTADTLSGAINEHEADISTLNSKLAFEAAYFYATYPNGHLSGQTNFSITVPYLNLSMKEVSVREAYVYDSNGNFTNILSSIGSISIHKTYCLVNITYNSSLVGKLLRLTIY